MKYSKICIFNANRNAIWNYCKLIQIKRMLYYIISVIVLIIKWYRMAHEKMYTCFIVFVRHIISNVFRSNNKIKISCKNHIKSRCYVLAKNKWILSGNGVMYLFQIGDKWSMKEVNSFYLIIFLPNIILVLRR